MKYTTFVIPSKYGFYPVKNSKRLNEHFINLDYDILDELRTPNYIGFEKIKNDFVFYLIPIFYDRIDNIPIDFINNQMITYNNSVKKWKLYKVEYDINITSEREYLITLNNEYELEKELSKLFRDEKIQRLKEKL